MQVSSANYKARAFGIRADMCIGEAKRLCPDLVVMPYQYDKYQVASEQASSSHKKNSHFITLTHLGKLPRQHRVAWNGGDLSLHVVHPVRQCDCSE